MQLNQNIISSFYSFIRNIDFPCVAAKDALAKDNVKIFIAENIACPVDDKNILEFMYAFTDAYRRSQKGFHSAAIIFKDCSLKDQNIFDACLWKRLAALRKMDEQNYHHDPRVDSNPMSAGFSFSIKEEAYFILALHAGSSRPARQFQYPTLIFNPHAQFEEMKTTARYEKLKAVVRKKDIALAGSINPMLADFGEASEVYQYSGRQYDKDWKCPLAQ